MKLNLDLIELKKEVFDFLEKGIKSTPENFKVIIDEVNEFNKKCDADLAIWASAAYDGWGAFRYMEIKISEGIPSNDDPNYVVLGENTMRELQHKDNIHRFILNYLEKKYPIFNEDNEDYDDELIDDFYEELCGLLKKDEKFDLYKKNYYYMMLAERMKERIEKILEWETLAYKTEEINQVRVCHNKKLIIPFGVKYKID